DVLEEAQAEWVVVGDQDARHRDVPACHRRVAFMRTLAQCRAMCASSIRDRVRRTGHRLMVVAVALGSGFACDPALAAGVRVRVAEIAQDFVQMRDVELWFDESGANRNLHLLAARLAIPRLDLAGELDWRCSLEREVPDAWACVGPLALQDTAAGKLAARLAVRVLDERVELEFTHEGMKGLVQIPLSAGSPVHASVETLPLAWLDRFLKPLWADGRLGGGQLDANAELAQDGTITAKYAIARLAFDSREGRIAGDQLGLAGELTVHAGGSPRIELDGELRGGEVLVGPFYAKWPATPVHFRIDARGRRARMAGTPVRMERSGRARAE